MTRKVSRREVLMAGGKLTLAGITMGSLNILLLENATHNALAAGGSNMAKTAGFGWECSNIHNDGADVYFKVNTAMTLNVIDIDVSCYINYTPTGAGSAEVLCMAAVSRGGPPTFTGGNVAYISQVSSRDFGSVQVYNPAGLSLGNNPTLSQDSLASIMLKTYIPTSGSGAYASRHVTTPSNLTLNVGDYLVFHMDHAGLQVDVEMQVVLNYQ